MQIIVYRVFSIESRLSDINKFLVPFGTDNIDDYLTSGTLIVYDTFDNDNVDEIIQNAVNLCKDRNFDKILVYPLHEKTSRRIDIDLSKGYKQRLKLIERSINDVNEAVNIEICKLEGKRNKYTPIDFALSFIEEHHEGPFFILMPDFIANNFATFNSYEKWIKRVRLMIYETNGEILHDNIINKRNRWEWV